MNSEISAPVRRVAVVGSGLIGAGWAAHFLAHGLDVVATDPAAGAEESLRRHIDRVWPIPRGYPRTRGAPTRAARATY